MKIVLLGPPGSGKGTQAELICNKYNIPHISTGDIFRQNIREKTPLGVSIEECIAKGELVPDSITNLVVEDRLSKEDCKNGFVLDGFPRNLEQSKFLDSVVSIDKAIMIDLDDEEIIKRLSTRRMCRKCGNPTNLDWLVDGKCEKCGGEVFIRQDDMTETIKNRLRKQKLPQEVVDFYQSKKIFERVSSLGGKEKTFDLVDKILASLKRQAKK